jgi:hypothetical protein
MEQVAYAQRVGYPVQFSVDYPDRPLNRLSTAFRVIPIVIVLSTVSGYLVFTAPTHAYGVTYVPALSGGVLFFAPLLMILFRRKYPRWWFGWNLELQRFINRVGVYLSLMDDRYPATDGHQSVHLDYSYPGRLNRWLPLVKWLLAIPHYIVLFFLDIAAFLILIVRGSPSWSPAATPAPCSNSSKASSAGTSASPPTPSPWSPTATPRSAWRHEGRLRLRRAGLAERPGRPLRRAD